MTRSIKLVSVALVFLSLPMIVGAQGLFLPPDQAVKRGEDVYQQTCTQSSCHGDKGTAANAPQLAGRGFDAAYIEKTVTFGITGSPMPAWGEILPQADVLAVIAYVESLNGIRPSASAGSPPALTGEAAQGQDLFFDSTNDARCSLCHRVTGKGVAVAGPIRNIPADVAGLRDLATPKVFTATVSGDMFPALVAAQLKQETDLYDLTVEIPVMRAFSPSAVKLKDGNSWKHSSALGNYSDADLHAILVFLRATQQPDASVGRPGSTTAEGMVQH